MARTNTAGSNSKNGSAGTELEQLVLIGHGLIDLRLH